jgi:hypothetical protein
MIEYSSNSDYDCVYDRNCDCDRPVYHTLPYFLLLDLPLLLIELAVKVLTPP